MILYKYRNFNTESKERVLQIINKQELYFSNIDNFNDPFDGKVFLHFNGKLNEIKAAQIRSQYTMALKKEEKYEGITFDQAHKLIDEKFSQAFVEDETEKHAIIERIQDLHDKKGILSLSSKNDNILMWSHYTFNHQGVCFGFDATQDYFAESKRVRYQSHYDDIWGWLHTDEEIVDRILFAKAADWRYEDEYRIVTDEPCVRKFSQDTLKEIIFGSRMSKDDKDEIIKECQAVGLSPSYRQAVLDIERYKINIEDYV
ncbi:DUF2971 domain-containing protein [Chryseobacterium salipaludis]|uniref:DUF2971 domain-containing protein n=1 Tax=Chryseobacterium TaxID=59732 RepID=UPI001FF34A9E|nr:MULTISPECIES: DUF2971 domain-containing protein [Chryseobacterium]MCJ8498344.1 DUF2971 domain-containing protein [Chryseobacterium salipaludis]MCX3297410.1 DUF2971 domain-containing protein [Planobacterium sp. JC490]